MLLDRQGLERQRLQIDFFDKLQLRSFIGFELVPGEIGGCVERGTAQVRADLVRVTRGADPLQHAPDGARNFRVARSGSPPLSGRIVVRLPAPLRSSGRYLHARTILLLLTPLQAAGFESVNPLRNVFGLTRAEARLAGCLAAGDDLASAAVRFGVSQGTLRGALKATLPKDRRETSGRARRALTRIDI